MPNSSLSDRLSADDLRGYFLLMIDIPGPYLKGELLFKNDHEYTFQVANLDYVSEVYQGTYNFQDGFFRGKHRISSNELIRLKMNFNQAKKSRVLAGPGSTPQADPDEVETGTEIKNGSQIRVWFDGKRQPYFRLLKLEKSFFEGVSPGSRIEVYETKI